MNRPYYFKHGVIEFFTKRKQNFYKVSLWDESGMNLSLIKTGKYEGQEPKSLIPELINCEDRK